MSYNIYTDGSAPINVSSPSNPAGWGFAVVQGDTGSKHSNGKLIEQMYGKVITDRNHFKYIGAEVGSNNTAELSAIYWALSYVEEQNLEGVTIYTDSMYALNLIFGNWKPKSNLTLVKNTKSLADTLGDKVTAKHIRAHSGLKWNELADELANRGHSSEATNRLGSTL